MSFFVVSQSSNVQLLRSRDRVEPLLLRTPNNPVCHYYLVFSVQVERSYAAKVVITAASIDNSTNNSGSSNSIRSVV